MSGPSTERRGNDGRWIGGIILILIGAGLLANQFVPDIGRYAPLAVGLGLLIIFLVTRNAGALIGGSIVTGIGVGLLMDEQFPASDGSWIPLCLGLGFLAIWVFGGLLRMPEARFWPLIPGGILTFVGIAAGRPFDRCRAVPGRSCSSSSASSASPAACAEAGRVRRAGDRGSPRAIAGPRPAGRARTAVRRLTSRRARASCRT